MSGSGVKVGPFWVVGKIINGNNTLTGNDSTWVQSSEEAYIYLDKQLIWDNLYISSGTIYANYTDPAGNPHHYSDTDNSIAYAHQTTADWAEYFSQVWQGSGVFVSLSNNFGSGGLLESGTGQYGKFTTEFCNGIYESGWDNACKVVEVSYNESSPGTYFTVKAPREGYATYTNYQTTSLSFSMTSYDGDGNSSDNTVYVKHNGAVVGQYNHNKYTSGYNSGWYDAYYASGKDGNTVTFPSYTNGNTYSYKASSSGWISDYDDAWTASADGTYEITLSKGDAVYVNPKCSSSVSWSSV